jgi:hypothetical protein
MENFIIAAGTVVIVAGVIRDFLKSRGKEKREGPDPLTGHQQKIAEREARKLRRALRKKERQYKRYVRRQKREGK